MKKFLTWVCLAVFLVAGVYACVTLAAMPRSMEDIDPEVGRIDLKLRFLSFGKNGYCNCGGMDPSAAFSDGNTFHAVNAAFKLHIGKGLRTSDQQKGFIDASQLSIAEGKD